MGKTGGNSTSKFGSFVRARKPHCCPPHLAVEGTGANIGEFCTSFLLLIFFSLLLRPRVRCAGKRDADGGAGDLPSGRESELKTDVG